MIKQNKEFQGVYEKGLEISGTLTDTPPRRARFNNLVNLLVRTHSMQGDIVECGCWKGLSSYVICHYVRKVDAKFSGANYHIFDSFEGLSKPSEFDALSETTIGLLKKDFGTVEGAFGSSTEHIRMVLQEFPNVNVHKGWIPDVFHAVPARSYKFVHIDVDLFEPTRGALEYFYPKLVVGGIMVCDDYGSKNWPGAKRAVEEFCNKQKLEFEVLSTGQAVILKRSFLERVARRLKSSVRFLKIGKHK